MSPSQLSQSTRRGGLSSSSPTPARTGSLFTRVRPADYISRAAYAATLAALDGGRADTIAKERYGADDTATIAITRTAVSSITRAAVSPATSRTSGWAADLVGTAAADFISSLGPRSAAAPIIDMGTRVILTGYGAATIPKRIGLPNPNLTFITEGGPIPFKDYTVDGVTFTTHTMGVGGAITRELASHSSGEQIIKMLLTEDGVASLDKEFFSTTVGTADRPGGLLAGVLPLSATAGANQEAMISDLAKLAAAITTAGGLNVVYVAHAGAAANANLRLNAGGGTIRVIPTLGLPAGSIMAIDPGALVSGFGALPRVEATTEGTIHMESATPAEIVAPGPVVASPVRSLWQTASVGIRAILDVAYVMRQPLVSVINNVTWA